MKAWAIVSKKTGAIRKFSTRMGYGSYPEVLCSRRGAELARREMGKPDLCKVVPVEITIME